MAIRESVRLTRYFTGRVLRYNVVLSLMVALFAFGIQTLISPILTWKHFSVAIDSFFLSLLTLGFAVSVFLYRHFRLNELLLYRNWGLSYSILCMYAYCVHFFCGVAAILIVYVAEARFI